MRLAIVLCLAALPAQAWDFSPTPVCTLSHDAAEGAVSVTYDPRRAEPYAIAVTRGAGWPAFPVFAMRFDGARPILITTDRQVLSGDGTTLTVTDRGFGNVLDGLQYNATATAILGAVELALTLDGAAPEVARFRACAEGGLA